MKRIYWVLLLLAPLTASATVAEYTLDNGLKVIVKEDHRAPVLVAQVWYKVGSSYEPMGLTGVSHILEHMMFKGTKKFGPGEFSRIIAENGGRENAFTGQDYTTYFQSLEKSRLAVSFEMESDRMRHLNLTQEEYAKELKVVMEERRMRTEDNPQSQTFEHFAATAYLNTPYRQPVIGWMHDLKTMKLEDLAKWYKKWYAPNNATLVVVGDVNPKQVEKLAKRYYGPLKPSENIPTLKPVVEAPQFGPRRIVVKRPAQLPYIVMGYHVPVLNSAKQRWEPYALEVLAGILSGGQSSRFKKHLERDLQVASSSSASYDLYARLNDLLVFSATVAKGRSVQELETAIRAQLERVRDERISEDELQRIKNQVVAGNVYERDSVYYQAMQIGMLETVGLGWRTADEYVDKVSAITAEQVQQVAQKYLLDQNLTVAVLDPQTHAGVQKEKHE